MNKKTTDQKAGLFRRLAAMFYDSLIVAAVLIAATVIALIFNRGQAIAPQNWFFTLYLISIVFIYFAWSWIAVGQTIGMRAWRLKIKTQSGKPFDIRHALMRFGFAIPALLLCGIGLLWMVADKQKLSWYDRWSKTYLILLSNLPDSEAKTKAPKRSGT